MANVEKDFQKRKKEKIEQSENTNWITVGLRSPKVSSPTLKKILKRKSRIW